MYALSKRTAICSSMYTRLYVYIHTYIHTYIYTYIFIYLFERERKREREREREQTESILYDSLTFGAEHLACKAQGVAVRLQG